MALLLIQGLILMSLVSFNRAANIDCNADTATITLTGDDAMELGLISLNDIWYAGDPDVRLAPTDDACTQEFNDTSLTISISSCSCKAESNGNTITVSWHIRKYTTDVYHRNDACILVICVYRADFNESVGITQILNKYTSTATSAVTDITVVIETFASEAARNACTPIENEFTVPARVYGKLRITNPGADSKFSIHVDNCYITPAVGDSSPKYSIVYEGEADNADGSNNYTGGVEDLIATFCFDSFAWVNGTIDTYVIQCTGVACVQNDNGDCSTNPYIGRRRRRRSTFDEMYFEAVSQPLSFISE